MQHEVHFVLQKQVLQVALQECKGLNVDLISGGPDHLPVQPNDQPGGALAINLKQPMATRKGRCLACAVLKCLCLLALGGVMRHAHTPEFVG